MAAVRAHGDGSALCGKAAAYLYVIFKNRPAQPEVITSTKRRAPGVRTCRVRRLDPRDVTTYRAIPVTTVPRTVVDLARELAPDELARVVHEAGIRYRVTPEAIESVLARRPNSRGAPELRRVLRGEVRVTLSRLEDRFLELLGEERLPLPDTNCRAGGRRVDCRWPQQRLTVELDGYRYHSSRHAWEQDRRRERDARARGDDFRRYTYGDVFEEPKLMLAELRELLRPRTRASAGA